MMGDSFEFWEENDSWGVDHVESGVTDEIAGNNAGDTEPAANDNGTEET